MLQKSPATSVFTSCGLLGASNSWSSRLPLSAPPRWECRLGPEIHLLMSPTSLLWF